MICVAPIIKFIFVGLFGIWLVGRTHNLRHYRPLTKEQSR